MAGTDRSPGNSPDPPCRVYDPGAAGGACAVSGESGEVYKVCCERKTEDPGREAAAEGQMDPKDERPEEVSGEGSGYRYVIGERLWHKRGKKKKNRSRICSVRLKSNWKPCLSRSKAGGQRKVRKLSGHTAGQGRSRLIRQYPDIQNGGSTDHRSGNLWSRF